MLMLINLWPLSNMDFSVAILEFWMVFVVLCILFSPHFILPHMNIPLMWLPHLLILHISIYLLCFQVQPFIFPMYIFIIYTPVCDVSLQFVDVTPSWLSIEI